ncbi:transposase [uncultured Bradyrhizobium sp.]|uniref:transposase n=1 Tax=Bradyrhizobium sp. TaxID=376 RepID=UPI00342BAEBD
MVFEPESGSDRCRNQAVSRAPVCPSAGTRHGSRAGEAVCVPSPPGGGDIAELDEWIAQAANSELKSFASGIARDVDAVRAAITTSWTTSPVEGQISRIKAIKRQMYGRASYPLLRRRVLLAA